MEYNDIIIQRRRLKNPSSYGHELLPQNNERYYKRNYGHGQIRGGSSSSYRPPALQQLKQSQAVTDNFLDHPTFYEQQRKLLYLTSPQPPSFRKTIVSQTPSRTMPYTSTNDGLDNIKQQNPAKDLGANSLFSYGCMCCQCVRTTEVGIVENFGKYQALLGPGFYCLPWPCTDISGRLSTRINQLEVVCESKTLDSVFCTISVTIPFRIITERVYDAYYRLTDPRGQIKSHVFDVVRSSVPKMTLDEVFQSKSKIAEQVSKHLKATMEYYGYGILQVLVTDVRPVDAVRQAMNEMNASKRLKIAMVYLADAEMIRIRKDAEAHCEELYLQGVGLSGQRRAIAKGLEASLDEFQKQNSPPNKSMNESASRATSNAISKSEVVNLLLITQYNDMLQSTSLCKEITNIGNSSSRDTISNLVLPTFPS